jgi:hypothetical protein
MLSYIIREHQISHHPMEERALFNKALRKEE